MHTYTGAWELWWWDRGYMYPIIKTENFWPLDYKRWCSIRWRYVYVYMTSTCVYSCSATLVSTLIFETWHVKTMYLSIRASKWQFCPIIVFSLQVVDILIDSLVDWWLVNDVCSYEVLGSNHFWDIACMNCFTIPFLAICYHAWGARFELEYLTPLHVNKHAITSSVSSVSVFLCCLLICMYTVHCVLYAVIPCTCMLGIFTVFI